MGCCLGTPVLRWASGFLVCLSLLLRISHTLANSPEAQGSGVTDPGGVHPAVKRMRGDSVWFPAILKSGEILEEITWGIGSESAYTNFLRVNSGPDSPKWLGLQDKFKGRVHVPNMTSLMIESLIPQDSGQYRVQAMHTGGLSYNQVFYLSVYESHRQDNIMRVIVVPLLVVLLLGAGIFLWRKRGKQKKNTKEKETEGGAALKEDHGADDDDIDYAQLAQQETQGGEKGRDEQHLEEKESVMTIYSKVHNTGQLMKII